LLPTDTVRSAQLRTHASSTVASIAAWENLAWEIVRRARRTSSSCESGLLQW
jgi:hypothetical protein